MRGGELLAVVTRPPLGLAVAVGLLGGGCQGGLSVRRLAGETLTLSVEGLRPAAALVELTAPAGCPAVPAELKATLNGRPATSRPTGGRGAAGCEPLRFTFPGPALEEGPHTANRFELSDSTGRIVVEVVDLARPHAFMSVNDPGAPFPTRPFFLQHQGGLAVSGLRAEWLAAGARLGDAGVLLRGASVEVAPPAAGRPTHLSLAWDEPIVVTTCVGVRRCQVDASRRQLLDVR